MITTHPFKYWNNGPPKSPISSNFAIVLKGREIYIYIYTVYIYIHIYIEREREREISYKTKKLLVIKI